MSLRLRVLSSCLCCWRCFQLLFEAVVVSLNACDGAGQLQNEDENASPLNGDQEVDVLNELFNLGLLSAQTLQQPGSRATQVAPRPRMETLANLGTQSSH